MALKIEVFDRTFYKKFVVSRGKAFGRSSQRAKDVYKRQISYALCRAKDADCDLRALSQHLNKALNGKGGGNQELCCGKLPVHPEEKIHQAIAEFLL